MRCDTVINIKLDAEVKDQAQAIADELGFSLSSLIRAYLKQLARTRQVNFTLPELLEVPDEEIIKAFEEAKAYISSPEFQNTDHSQDTEKFFNLLDERIEKDKQEAE